MSWMRLIVIAAAVMVCGAGVGLLADGRESGGTTVTATITVVRTVQVPSVVGTAPPAPPPAAPPNEIELYSNEHLTLRDRKCGGDTYVTLDDPPTVSKSSSSKDAFSYNSCASEEPLISIGGDIEASPLSGVTSERSTCLAALRADEAEESTPISKVVALCFRTTDGTIAELSVDKVDRDGTAHVAVRGWKDE